MFIIWNQQGSFPFYHWLKNGLIMLVGNVLSCLIEGKRILHIPAN
uniref:Uncharacterized protein n=1 Tax=Anguilla anguilla TaxID=7936 RepID=A0A0E9ST98_ANGAN